FSRHIEYAAGSVSNNLNFMLAADFNGDGALDLALANFGDKTGSILVNSPVAAFVPRALTFAAQEIGTLSSEQAVTVTNPSAAPLAISNIIASGDFMQSNDCGSTLDVGKSCQVSVTFLPTAAGSRR